MSRSEQEHRTDRVGYILDHPEKRWTEVEGMGGALSALFRRVLKAKDINKPKWSKLILRYLTRFPAPKRSDKVKPGSRRANLNKELTEPSMSWKVLCKGLIFTGVPHATLTLRFPIMPGVYVEESVDIDFGEDVSDTSFLWDDLKQGMVRAQEVYNDGRPQQNQNPLSHDFSAAPQGDADAR